MAAEVAARTGMLARWFRILPLLLLALTFVTNSIAANDSIAGEWIGVSEELGSVYRLHLTEGGGGTLKYVSHVRAEPELRSYTVHGWKLESGRLTLELKAVDGAPALRLSGKLKQRQLVLGIVRRKGAKPESLRMSRESEFLRDYDLLRNVGAPEGAPED